MGGEMRREMPVWLCGEQPGFLDLLGDAAFWKAAVGNNQSFQYNKHK